jgi:poly(3-hydroxybutyrate) depolymerase
MSRLPRHLAVLALSLVAACSAAPTRNDSGRFVQRDFVMDGATHRYQVFVPSRAAGGRHPPVILFLHGSGERGNDGAKPVAVGIGTYVRAHLADFPAIVVFPQAPENTEWSGASARLALGTLDAASHEFHGDARRTYLTGCPWAVMAPGSSHCYSQHGSPHWCRSPARSGHPMTSGSCS